MTAGFGKLVSVIRAYPRTKRKLNQGSQMFNRNLSYFGKCQARYQGHGIGDKSEQKGIHCNWPSLRTAFDIH